MSLFGKSLSNYAAFCKFFLVLIPVVGIIRLVLSLNGTPVETARWLSMSALVWIAVIYYSIRVHTAGFGSYKHLLVVCALLNVSTQVISILAITIAIFTGTSNVFSAPEFSFSPDLRIHLVAHLFLGTIAGSLVPWLPGSLILAVTRKVSGAPERISRSSI